MEKTFNQKYPTLTKIFESIALDNGLELKQPIEIIRVDGLVLADVEETAKRLSAAQLETFATGEERQIARLVNKYGLYALQWLVERVLNTTKEDNKFSLYKKVFVR